MRNILATLHGDVINIVDTFDVHRNMSHLTQGVLNSDVYNSYV